MLCWSKPGCETSQRVQCDTFCPTYGERVFSSATSRELPSMKASPLFIYFVTHFSKSVWQKRQPFVMSQKALTPLPFWRLQPDSRFGPSECLLADLVWSHLTHAPTLWKVLKSAPAAACKHRAKNSICKIPSRYKQVASLRFQMRMRIINLV